MLSKFNSRYAVLCLAIIALLSVSSAFSQDKDDKGKKKKLTAAEVVAKHIESMGGAEAVAAAKSRVLTGIGSLSSKVRDAQTIGGPAQFASQGNMMLFAMVFNASDYPYEKAAFDGKDVTIGLPNGRRSQLADFLKSKATILKEGLLGGALSSAWPLLDVEGRKAKLDYAGLTKFEDQPAHKLKYSPRDGDLRISLFFDAETFRHLATVYEYSIQPRMGVTSTASVSEQVTHIRLTEEFSDFKTAEKLTLPLTYTLTVSSQGQAASTVGSTQLEWKMNFDKVFFNESLEASLFKVS